MGVWIDTKKRIEFEYGGTKWTLRPLTRRQRSIVRDAAVTVKAGANGEAQTFEVHKASAEDLLVKFGVVDMTDDMLDALTDEAVEALAAEVDKLNTLTETDRKN